MDDRRTRFLKRLAGVLARTRSSNEHEADTARQTLRALQEKHGVSDAELDEYVEAGERAFEDAGQLEDDYWQIRIALAVAERVGCKAVKRDDHLFFEGTARKTRRALGIYASISRRVLDECEGIRASYGNPPVYAPVVRPILLEEAARAVSERLVGREMTSRFPVPVEAQRALLDYHAASAHLHVYWAKKDGRRAGLFVDLDGLSEVEGPDLLGGA